MTDEPRPQHFFFAHYFLRELAFAEPEEFLGLMRGPRRNVVLRRFWEKIGGDLSPDGLSAIVVELARHDLVVVTLPPAEKVTEAIYVGIAIGRPGKRFFFFRRPPTVRFFTMDHGAPGTALGEWSPEGVRSGHGDGPPVHREQFLCALRDLINRPIPGLGT